jgi:type VI protein secretion system component Hcp
LIENSIEKIILEKKIRRKNKMPEQFIKFDGVDGESQMKGVEKWIEISNFSLSSSTPGSTGKGGGSGVGKPVMHGASFGTTAGRHSPLLNKKYFEGQHFKKVEVKYLKQASSAQPEMYYYLIMDHVFITSIGNSKGEGSLGYETITLTAEIYKQEYFAQDEKGQLKSVGSTTYNEKTGVSS